MELTQEEIDAWVARHLADAPERDEAWHAMADEILFGPLDEVEAA